MIKVTYYCGEDQMERYLKMMNWEAGGITPIYQEFLDKTEEFRNRRLKQHEESSENEQITKEDVDNKNAEKEKTLDFCYDIFDTETGGPKARFQWNIDAITTLKAIEAEGRFATSGEQKILSRYVGWVKSVWSGV